MARNKRNNNGKRLLTQQSVDQADKSICLAKLHWYEAHGIGKKEIKRKRFME